MLDLTEVLKSKTVLKKKSIVKELLNLPTWEDMFSEEETLHIQTLDGEEAKAEIYNRLVEKLEADPTYEIWDNLYYYVGTSVQKPLTEDELRVSGFTFISSKGRIINFNNPTVKHKGHIWGDGYGYFSAIFEEYKYQTVKIHRAVASTFIPKEVSVPYFLAQPNHLNGFKSENDILNLEWTTGKLNTVHAHENGLIKIDSGLNDTQTKPLVLTLLHDSSSFILAGQKEMLECRLDPSAVSKVCQGKVGTHRKCVFRYATEDELKTIPRITAEVKQTLCNF